jgi:hypothetical protein
VTEKLTPVEMNKIEFAAEEAVRELENKGSINPESLVARNYLLEVTVERVQRLVNELRSIRKEKPFRTHLANREVNEIEIAVDKAGTKLSAADNLSECINAMEILAQEVTPKLALTLVEEVRWHREREREREREK